MGRNPRVKIFVTGILWSVLSAVFFLRHTSGRGWIFAILAALFICSAAFVPPLARLFHRSLATAIEIAVTLLTWILLGITYFLFFLPLGLILRLTGSLRISKGPNVELATYWVDRKAEPHSVARYLRPF